MLLNELKVDAVAAPELVDDVRAALSRAFWKMYAARKDEVVVAVKLPIIGIRIKSVRWRDLYSVFVWIFGPPAS
jgi:hypothetical protein